METPISKKIEVIGHLEIWSQEGGHAAPAVSIGQEDLASLIEYELKEFAENNKYSKHFDEIGRLKGTWKIVVERIS